MKPRIMFFTLSTRSISSYMKATNSKLQTVLSERTFSIVFVCKIEATQAGSMLCNVIVIHQEFQFVTLI